jgi:hypothetical protein
MALANALLTARLQRVVMKMVNARRGLGLVATAGFCSVGCAPGNMTPLNDPPHALTPRSPEQVEMFMTGRPTRPYAEVALIDGAHLPMARVRECAAQLGCDALYVDVAAKRFQQGICLVFTDVAAPAAPPAPSGLWAQNGTKWNCDAGSVETEKPHPTSGGL